MNTKAAPANGSSMEDLGPLVERLGDLWHHADCRRAGELLKQQAAEIERLRADAARQNKLMHLASHDLVFFGGFMYDPEEREFRVPAPLVLCNDFFAPAADCEELPIEDIDGLHAAFVHYGPAGVLAWVSLRREGANPWRLKPDSEFQAEFNVARNALRSTIGLGVNAKG